MRRLSSFPRCPDFRFSSWFRIHMKVICEYGQISSCYIGEVSHSPKIFINYICISNPQECLDSVIFLGIVQSTSLFAHTCATCAYVKSDFRKKFLKYSHFLITGDNFQLGDSVISVICCLLLRD